MLISGERKGPYLVLTVQRARIDAEMTDAFKAEALDHLACDQGDCLLDLNKVGFMDSSGIGALVGLLKLVGGERNLVLCGLSPAVAATLRLARLDRVFSTMPSVADAVRRIQHGPATA